MKHMTERYEYNIDYNMRFFAKCYKYKQNMETSLV